eukprot:COSAG01_NODE_27535_length_683_cov_1.087329_2_plen_78_part_00
MRGKGGVRMVIEGYGDRVKKENAGERDVDKMVSSRPRSNSGPPGHFMRTRDTGKTVAGSRMDAAWHAPPLVVHMTCM